MSSHASRDPEDTAALEDVIDGILGDPYRVHQKKKNARALARELIDPAVAVKPLVRIMETL